MGHFVYHAREAKLSASLDRARVRTRGRHPRCTQAPSDALCPRLLLIVLRVDFGETRPLFRQIIQGEDGGNGANRDARAAVDALHGIDIELRQLRRSSPSSLRGWMQSTGQTSTQAVSLVLIQGSAIIYAMKIPPEGLSISPIAGWPSVVRSIRGRAARCDDLSRAFR